MTKKRNRAKQTTTLDARLSKFTTDLRRQAKTLQSNTSEALQLQKRIRSCEAALRLNLSLNSGR